VPVVGLRRFLVRAFSGEDVSAPILSYGSPRTIPVGTSPTVSPDVGGGPATSFAEVAGAPNTLSELNYLLDTSSGDLDALSGSGATPPNTYVVWIKAIGPGGVSNTFVLTIIVSNSAGSVAAYVSALSSTFGG
jgi:hypothetical protein